MVRSCPLVLHLLRSSCLNTARSYIHHLPVTLYAMPPSCSPSALLLQSCRQAVTLCSIHSRHPVYAGSCTTMPYPHHSTVLYPQQNSCVRRQLYLQTPFRHEIHSDVQERIQEAFETGCEFREIAACYSQEGDIFTFQLLFLPVSSSVPDKQSAHWTATARAF